MFETAHPALAQALTQRGYESLTPVQDAVLNPDYAGQDLIVSAQTGSGKTVAFGLAMAAELLGDAEKLEWSHAPRALVIAPTRELAMQVMRELEWLYAPAGGRIVSCVGGMDARDERRALDRGAHIVVGTPGRLVDHLTRGALVLSDLKSVVLDEADEMLNMGFRDELEEILKASPEDRRTLMFSATMPRGIEGLARSYMRDALRVNTVGEKRQHGDIEYRALVTASHEAENAIYNVLRFYDAPNAIVFCATRAEVTRLTARFTNRGVSVVALSGDLSQAQRNHALQALRDKRAQVCIATDVAARGIDLPDLELVIHADLPRNTEALLHRSGRTGRAGRKGVSVLVVPHKARRHVERLLRDAKITAEWAAPPTADEVIRRDEQRLLADPVLTDPIQESEQGIIRGLLSRHEPEQIAAAFFRLYQKGKSAPEDISVDAVEPPRERRERAPREDRYAEGAPKRPQKPLRDNFQGGVWASLSVGRTRAAEPRWLIPIICNGGDISKPNLGSIRIDENETFVELDPQIADAFFEKVGPDGQLEKGVRITRLAAKPADPAPQAEAPAEARAPRKERPPERPKKTWSPIDPAPAAAPATFETDDVVRERPARRDDRKPQAREGGKPEGKKGPKPAPKPGGKPDYKSDRKFEGKPRKPAPQGVLQVDLNAPPRAEARPERAGKPEWKKGPPKPGGKPDWKARGKTDWKKKPKPAGGDSRPQRSAQGKPKAKWIVKT